MIATKNIYTIYASQDNDVLLYLLLYLKPLEKDFDVAIWHDDPIYPEQPWKPQNASRLNATDIFLLLVSNAFMHSEFIKQDEFKVIIDRYKKRKSIVIPIILDDCPWDIDFNSGDYDFNLKELQVLPADGNSITDWNSADNAFMQVIGHLKEVITSFTENLEQEKPVKRPKRKTVNRKKNEQIEINFAEERERNRIAEEDLKLRKTKIIKRAEEEKRLSNEAEVASIAQQERKLLKETKDQKRIEEQKRIKVEAEVKMVVQEEKQLIQEEQAKKEVEEKRPYEITKSERATGRENRGGEVVTGQKRVIKKNRLARYNYQFKTGKLVKAKRVAQEVKWKNEEAKAQIETEVKRRVEITKSGSATELEKRRVEIDSIQKRVMKKSRLSRYNYQFKTTNIVEAKRVVQEEKWENEEAKAQIGTEVKRRVEITKSGSATELEKRLGEKDAAQKRVMKKNRLAEYNYKFKTAKAVKAKRAFQEERKGNKEARAQTWAEVKRRAETTKSGGAAELEKRLGAVVAALKGVIKKIRLALGQRYQFISAKIVKAKRAVQVEKQGNEEAKVQTWAEVKRWVETTKSRGAAELEKRRGAVVAALKGVIKKIRLALGQRYQFISAKIVKAKRAFQEERQGNEEARGQTWAEVKRWFETTKSRGAAELEKRLGAVVAALKRVQKQFRRAVGNYYQFKSAVEANQNPIETKKKSNTKEKRRIHPGFLIAALLGFGLLIYVFTGDSEKQSTTFPEIETTKVDSSPSVKTETSTANQGAAFSKLSVGDTYEGGLIFTIDQSNKMGKIAYPKDTGLMKWTNAMKIHEQLGEGWRLPTMDELQLMYQNIGQGATNSGQFANELYWSATPYDENQARLLRFRDGNRSYHYNKDLPNRKFQVRAIRDFSW